jgi:predicted kinase
MTRGVKFMPTLNLMMGLPGLGKTTYAKKILDNNKDVILVSSDDLRSCLLNNIERQDENKLIFLLMQHITLKAMQQGKSVIYDATNTSRERRKELVDSLASHIIDLEVTGHFCVGDYKDAMDNNNNRSRKVPYDVIKRMAKQFDIPTARDEDYMESVRYFAIETYTFSKMENLASVKSYDEFVEIMSKVNTFADILDMPQDCPYHTLSVSRHTYAAFEYARKHMPIELSPFIEEILFALAFHDIGKGICKSFWKGSRYAHFTGHEKVSAQIFLAEAMRHPHMKKLNKEFVAALIAEHCFPYKEKDENAYNTALAEIEGLYGKHFRDCLEFVRTCDMAAK